MSTYLSDFAAEREAMVERQLRRRGITETAILDAFRTVPREAFVSREYAHLAYGDHPLPIEAHQTISQPYIVGLMIEAAGIGPGDTVLEVGAGSGYAAAVISRVARTVVGIERQHELAELARERLRRRGYDTVEIDEGETSGKEIVAEMYDVRGFEEHDRIAIGMTVRIKHRLHLVPVEMDRHALGIRDDRQSGRRVRSGLLTKDNRRVEEAFADIFLSDDDRLRTERRVPLGMVAMPMRVKNEFRRLRPQPL